VPFEIKIAHTNKANTKPKYLKNNEIGIGKNEKKFVSALFFSNLLFISLKDAFSLSLALKIFTTFKLLKFSSIFPFNFPKSACCLTKYFCENFIIGKTVNIIKGIVAIIINPNCQEVTNIAIINPIIKNTLLIVLEIV
jgi:hypothetical protein